MTASAEVNHALRQAISFFNMPLLGQPEVYVGNAQTLFDEAGELTDETTAEFFRSVGAAFAAHIERNLAGGEVRKAA